MTFWPLLILEIILIAGAGLIFIAGIRGLMTALVSLIAYLWLLGRLDIVSWQSLTLVIGLLLGILMFCLIRKKVRENNLTAGFSGSIISLVIFGAFLNPLMTLISWLLVIGTGLIPFAVNKQKFWVLVPAAFRVLLGTLFIIYGNILV